MRLNEITIKLGANAAPGTQEFMQDYYSLTQPHPINQKSRIYNNTVALQVAPFGRSIHISDIQSFVPRSGAGTAAIKFLISLANKHGVKLDLTAKAYATDKRYVTSTKKLIKWYQSLGFELEDQDGIESCDLVYYPK